MWRSLSFVLYVGSICVLDFPQIGLDFALVPDALQDMWVGYSYSTVFAMPVIIHACVNDYAEYGQGCTMSQKYIVEGVQKTHFFLVHVDTPIIANDYVGNAQVVTKYYAVSNSRSRTIIASDVDFLSSYFGKSRTIHFLWIWASLHTCAMRV